MKSGERIRKPSARRPEVSRPRDVVRFQSRAIADGACLRWTLHTTPGGYGVFQVRRKGVQVKWLAHRWLFQHLHGYLPSVVMHSCDHPWCVRPEHLLPGTDLTNVQDAIRKGRRRALSVDVVLALRAAVLKSSLCEAARLLGIPRTTAQHIVARRSWRHV